MPRLKSGARARCALLLDGASSGPWRFARGDERRAGVGRFYSPELDASYEVRLEGGALRLVPPGNGEALELSPLEHGSFHGGGMRPRFENGNGKADGYLLDLGRIRGLVFERSDQQAMGEPK